MSSLDLDAEVESRPGSAGVPQLLDATFGFFVGAAHLLAIYISAAVACQIGLATAGEASQSAFLATLVLLTIATAAGIILHALLRYRRFRGRPDRQFRMFITVGCDAIATVAVLWQLYPLMLTPLCA